jgi:hypothetical protein
METCEEIPLITQPEHPEVVPATAYVLQRDEHTLLVAIDLKQKYWAVTGYTEDYLPEYQQLWSKYPCVEIETSDDCAENYCRVILLMPDEGWTTFAAHIVGDEMQIALWREATMRALRVLRGGSWSSDPGWLRVSYRSLWDPSYGGGNSGFRCILPIEVAR